MRGGGSWRDQPSSKANEEYEVHVGAVDKPPPPPSPHRLLRLNIKAVIYTSCSSLCLNVNKHSLSSFKVPQERDVGSIACVCPIFNFIVLIFVDIQAHLCGFFFYICTGFCFSVSNLLSDMICINQAACGLLDLLLCVHSFMILC